MFVRVPNAYQYKSQTGNEGEEGEEESAYMGYSYLGLMQC